jgi:hypothetical protein
VQIFDWSPEEEKESSHGEIIAFFRVVPEREKPNISNFPKDFGVKGEKTEKELPLKV